MRSEAGFGSAAVRYASVGTGLVARTGAEKPTDGGGGSGYTDRHAPLLASHLPFQEVCAVWASSPSWPGGGSRGPGLNAQANSACRSTLGSGAPFALVVRATVTVTRASA